MSKKALQRIPLLKLLDLKVDFAFKQLFGSERNKHIIMSFWMPFYNVQVGQLLQKQCF